MKSVFFLLLFGALSCVGAFAQEQDRIEIFGGYSYTGYSVFGLYSGPWTRYWFNGWEASGAVKFAPHVSAEGDFSGGWSSSPWNEFSFRTYMAGPRISGQYHRVGVYGHVLFGGLTLSAIFNGPRNSFATALGGGTDLWVSRRFGVRLIQADCILNHNAAAVSTDLGGPGPLAHLRISTGVTFRFGH